MRLVSYSSPVARFLLETSGETEGKGAKRTMVRSKQGLVRARLSSIVRETSLLSLLSASASLSFPTSLRGVTIIIAVEPDDREMRLLSHYRFELGHHRWMLRWLLRQLRDDFSPDLQALG